VHPLVEGDEIRQRPVGDVQALELHVRGASSGFGRQREVTIWPENALAARAGGDLGLDRLGQSEHHPRALLGIAQQELVVGVA